MNNRPPRDRNPHIKKENKDDDGSNKSKKINTRTQSNQSKIDPSKISPAQLKDISKSKSVPKLISNIPIQGSLSNQASALTSMDNTFLTDQSYQLETFTAIESTDDIVIPGEQITDNIDIVTKSLSLPIEKNIVDSSEDSPILILQDVEPVELGYAQPSTSNTSNTSVAPVQDKTEKRNKIKYTPDIVTDALDKNDSCGEYIGYVDFVDEIKDIPEHGKFFKMVLNNNSNRRMMVTSWNNNIPATAEFANIGNVLRIQGLMIKEMTDRRNLGTGPLYFETQSITTYKLLGKLDNLPIDCGYCKVNFETFANAQGLICIEGVVKTEPRLQKSSVIGSRIIGGISNGSEVLEINLPGNQNVDHVMKGQHVKVLGALIKKTHGLHVLKVSKSEHILKMPGETIDTLDYFLNAITHV
ncbi:hypothetical protein QAD02_011324 [Eretmocerus hayati]|uniref:Uncharacterized protein n=1 Tax=Eretmocerus hayati TaxID=131215 RepID=A0ACC2NXF1_9HYME|nr:hypothetical protein QAD02_011324 [Eretmocerus hayati]